MTYFTYTGERIHKSKIGINRSQGLAIGAGSLRVEAKKEAFTLFASANKLLITSNIPVYVARLERFVAPILLQLTPDLDKSMTITHPRYGRLDTRFSDILQHVVNHGTYHRGNITAMLRQLGYSGIPTDFVFYLFKQQSRG